MGRQHLKSIKLYCSMSFFSPETTLQEAHTYVPRVQQKTPRSQRKIGAKKMRPPAVYLCGVCKSDCKDEDDLSDAKHYSVSCDKCYTWFHWGCVVFDGSCDVWYCMECKAD